MDGSGDDGLDSGNDLRRRIGKQGRGKPAPAVVRSSRHAKVGKSGQDADEQSMEESEEGNVGDRTATPAKVVPQSSVWSTPVSITSGSSRGDTAEDRMDPMKKDLTHRSYVSTELLDKFLEGTPEVTQGHVDDLRQRGEWKAFIDTCTGGKKDGVSPQHGPRSNEKEFEMLIQCIAKLPGLTEYFQKPQENAQQEPEINGRRRGCVRMSHQGNIPMTTWNIQAGWLSGNSGSTEKRMELKPDFMTVVVEDAERGSVRVARPTTILPPPDDWRPAPISDEGFPMVEWKKPVWECLDLFWECKRNSQQLKNAEVYIGCALKAAEALRYQWSRRYVCCFLHCGSKMRLLHFDRSGLVASEPLDVEEDTVKFVRCVLGAFCHGPDRLGYPAGKEAPTHQPDLDGKLRQVVTVGGRQLYIDDQVTGPPRDHLVSRATVTFKAKLVNPEGEEKAGWDWCYKSSWPQAGRKHEGYYLEKLKGLPHVVELLVYGVVKVGETDQVDDTHFGRRGCISGEAMTFINTYKSKISFGRQAETSTLTNEDGQGGPSAPRGPESRSDQNYDNREHRDVVTEWVEWSFDGALFTLDSLSTRVEIWKQAFQAMKAITEKGIIHRDISFRNIRVDDQNRVKVCDFDMAMFLDGESTGAQNRTGTIAFIAAKVLELKQYIHQPIHDCESIFWLCALELLPRFDAYTMGATLARIYDRKDLEAVADAKVAFVSRHKKYETLDPWPRNLASLKKEDDRRLFLCLTALMREFDKNDFQDNYQDADPRFKDDCFDRCIQIIQKECVLGEFAGMSLSGEDGGDKGD